MNIVLQPGDYETWLGDGKSQLQAQVQVQGQVVGLFDEIKREAIIEVATFPLFGWLSKTDELMELRRLSRLAEKFHQQGQWKAVARCAGDSLDIQSAFSGKPIKYRKGLAYIEEFELDEVFFDRVRNGVLGEVKGNYDFATKLAQNGEVRFLEGLLKEAQRQTRVAKKHGVSLEWHVRRQDLPGFVNTIGRRYPEIKFVPYDP